MTNINNIGENEFAEEKPSKSARKRKCLAIQKLGEDLAKLPADARNSLNLPDELKEALEELDKVTSREGKRRHIQFIGKLMRELDADQIEKAVALYQQTTLARKKG